MAGDAQEAPGGAAALPGANDKDERPERPEFVSGLPHREPLKTPRTVAVVRVALLLSLVAYLVPTAMAGMRQDEIREPLRASLAKKAPDYSAVDIRHAVIVTLIGIAVVGLLVIVLELVAARSLARRQAGGRTVLVLLGVLNLPVLVVVVAFRAGGTLDIALAGAELLLLLVACVAALLPRTKHWLDARPPIEVRPLSGFGTSRPT